MKKDKFSHINFEELKKLNESGHTLKSIAEMYDITLPDVSGLFKKNGVKPKINFVPKHKNTNDVDTYKLWYAINIEGKPQYKLVKEFGISDITYKNKLETDEYKVYFETELYKKKISDKLETDKNIIEYAKSQHKVYVEPISKKFNKSESYIKKLLTEYGIETAKKYGERTDVDIEYVWHLHTKEKMPILNISKKLGISETVIYDRLEKIGKENINYKDSFGERELRDFIRELGLEVKKSRKVLNNRKEIDVFIPFHNLGIEYCGLYWHSDEIISRNAHYEKYKSCKDIGIQLLTIFDAEWEQKKDIIKSVIKSKLGIFETRMFARKCIFSKIESSEAKKFHIEHHLQGAPRGCKDSYGLFSGGKLVAVITYSNHPRKSNQKVLSRLTFAQGIQIIGGAQKLFQNSLLDMKLDYVLTWSDNRWSTGKIYEILGFEKEEELPIDYFYSDKKNMISKQSMKKDNFPELKKAGLTEKQIADSRGYIRIWDCGKIRWSYKNGTN